MLTASLQQQFKHDTPYAWFLRHQASLSPIFRKQHLAELDDRLEAYLDCYLISERADNYYKDKGCTGVKPNTIGKDVDLGGGR